MIVTGIGSRETPDNILQEMEKIGKQLADNGYYVRSGHAQGADYAFEIGAKDKCIAYLPWPNFNKNLPYLGRVAVVSEERKSHSKRVELVRNIHPNPDALSGGAWALMERNTCQVLGLDLDSPSDIVVCWTHDGKASGGTGMAIRLAERRGIPVLNMHSEKWNIAEKVLEEIL